MVRVTADGACPTPGTFNDAAGNKRRLLAAPPRSITKLGGWGGDFVWLMLLVAVFWGAGAFWWR